MSMNDFFPDFDAICPVAFDGSIGPGAGAIENIDIASYPGVSLWEGVIPRGKCPKGV